MTNLTADKELLNYLSYFGVGIYIPITDQLFKMFDNYDYRREFRKNDSGVIWNFLNHLQQEGFIKYKVMSYTDYGTAMIDATITSKGMEFISSKDSETATSNIYNFGDNAQIGQLSSSSSNTDISLKTKYISPKKPTKISTTAKIISSIVGSLFTFVLIVKGIIILVNHSKKDHIELTAPSKSDTSKSDSTTLKLKDSLPQN
jgi:hypothetical protein